MADAKIMTFGELFSATTDVIPDNKAAAVEIEGLDGNDYIKINTTNSSEAVQLVSSGIGRVSIGTHDPYTSINADADNLVVGDGTGNEGITIVCGSGAGDYGSIYFGDPSSGTQGQIRYEQNNEVMSFYTNTAERMRIDLDGDVTMNAGLNVANTAVLGTDGVAIGSGCTAAGANAISVGHNAIASNTKSLALGNGANSSSSGAIAMGPSCQSAATNSVAIGTNSARTEGAYSMALGYFSQTKRPFEQTFTSATYGVDKKASSQRKFVSGQCQTTDDTVTTMLDAENAGSTAMLVNTTNCQTTDKSSTTFFNVRVVSTVTGGDEDSDFEIGEFLARSYTFAIKWVYDASTPTISMISDSAGTAIASDATIYAARENVRASNAVISHATNGIVDSITLVADPGDQAGRGAWKFRVQSANDGATIRHSCFVDQVDHILA